MSDPNAGIGLLSRVMLVIHSMRGGGSERQMSYLANEMASRYETKLVTLDGDVSSDYFLDQRIERVGLGLQSSRGGLVRGAIANRQRVRAIAGVAADAKPDVVISFCDTTNILTSLACGRDYPVILCERSDPRRQSLGWVWEKLRDYAYPMSRVCISQTDEVSNYLSQRMARRASRVQWRTIPSAIQMPSDDEMTTMRIRVASQIESRAGQGRGRRLVYIGRLSREKRVDRLLQSWESLTQESDGEFGGWELVLVGDGTERQSLERIAQDRKLPRITWRGWSDDVWSELAAADAFCLTSEYEGFPQAMLEAMAAGVAVVTLDCSPAIRETITDGVDGAIVPSESALTDSLRQVLGNDAFREKLGRAGASRAKSFTWSALAGQWSAAIEAAVGTRG